MLLGHFDPLFKIDITYSFVHCLLTIISVIANDIHFRKSYTGVVFRSMLMKREDIYKYIVGSKVLATAFFLHR